MLKTPTSKTEPLPPLLARPEVADLVATTTELLENLDDTYRAVFVARVEKALERIQKAR